MLAPAAVRSMRVLPLCCSAIRQEFLADHFRPGNIIRSDYWGSFDRVIESRWSGGAWSVLVEEVRQVEGQWLAVGPRRSHGTYPSHRDAVVSRGSEVSHG